MTQKLRVLNTVKHKGITVKLGTVHDIVFTYSAFVPGKGAVIKVDGEEIPLKPGEWKIK